VEIPVTVSITRVYSNQGEECIGIAIRDDDARVRFLKIHMPLADFAQCVVGSMTTQCVGEVSQLDCVGKKLEINGLSFEMPSGVPHNQLREVAYKRALEEAPAGWVPDSYFGSQGSFYTGLDGKHMAQTNIRRWVDKEETST